MYQHAMLPNKVGMRITDLKVENPERAFAPPDVLNFDNLPFLRPQRRSSPQLPRLFPPLAFDPELVLRRHRNFLTADLDVQNRWGQPAERLLDLALTSLRDSLAGFARRPYGYVIPVIAAVVA